jgi:hypothetical protein
MIFLLLLQQFRTHQNLQKKTRTNSRTENVRQKKVDFDLSAIFCRPFFTRIIKSPIWEKARREIIKLKIATKKNMMPML